MASFEPAMQPGCAVQSDGSDNLTRSTASMTTQKTEQRISTKDGQAAKPTPNKNPA
jgi:hypothetical protein